MSCLMKNQRKEELKLKDFIEKTRIIKIKINLVCNVVRNQV